MTNIHAEQDMLQFKMVSNIVLSSTENKRNLNMRLCLYALLTQFTDSDSLLTAHLWPAAVAVHVTLNQSQSSDSFNTAELCFSHLILYVCVWILESSVVSICALDLRIVCSDSITNQQD